MLHHSDYLALCATLPEASVDLILTDPPYGITRNVWDTKLDLVALFAAFNRILKPHAPLVLTAQLPFSAELVMANKRNFRHDWVWEKPMAKGFLNANKAPMRSHEQILVFSHKQPIYNPQMVTGKWRKVGAYSLSDNYGTFEFMEYHSNQRYPRSVLRFNHDTTANTTNTPTKPETHPTQKPLELWRYLMLTYSHAGDLVLDPFCGSGTTAIAAEQTGRRWICGDSNLEYIQMAQTRLDKLEAWLPEIPPSPEQRGLFE